MTLSPVAPAMVRPLRLSPTSLHRWRECPHAYWHAYIRKSPAEVVFNRPMERGGALHNVLKECFDNLQAAGDFPGDLAALAAAYLPPHRYPDRETWREDVRWIAGLVAGYLGSVSAAQSRTHLLGLEWSCGYTHAAYPTFVLTARADRVVRLADGRVRIIEYKSGKPDTYDLVQIAALHLCVASALHCDEQMVTVSTVFLRTNDEREWTFGPGIAEYRARIIDIAHEIREAMPDAVRFAPTPGPFCQRCPYIGLCPAAPDEFR
jgi:CRISPR/Cas system-associated exonuclease Cas4 (RecB family)